MSNDLVPSEVEIKTIEKLSKCALESKFFDKLGGQSGIFSIMMYAKELGLSPMQAIFGGMHNVMGKVEIAPVMMNAMIRKAGHKLEILKHDNNMCVIKGTRKEDSSQHVTVTYTIQDAKTAGIYKEGGGWTKYPQDMLFARTISRLGRRLFPDVIGSMYVEGELSDSPEAISQETVTVETVGEESQAAAPEDITLERSAELLSQFIPVENTERLRNYIADAMTRTRTPLAEVTNRWIEKKEKFIEYYNAWQMKQAEAAQT